MKLNLIHKHPFYSICKMARKTRLYDQTTMANSIKTTR